MRRVPVEFLTDDQAAAHEGFVRPPGPQELRRYFFLDDEDRKLVGKRRGDHNRLGFSLQLVTARYLGKFLDDPGWCRGKWSTFSPNSWRSRTPRA